jgi:hypothetical protein
MSIIDVFSNVISCQNLNQQLSGSTSGRIATILIASNVQENGLHFNIGELVDLHTNVTPYGNCVSTYTSKHDHKWFSKSLVPVTTQESK